MAVEPRTVVWRNEKWDGSLNRQAELQVVRVDEEGVWLWIARATPIDRPQHPYPHPCDGISFVPAHGDWAATWLFDVEPALYVDVMAGVEIGDDAIRSIDIDLDVVRYRDGSVRLLDEDELATNAEVLRYPAEVVERARSIARELVEALHHHRAPFGVLPTDRAIADAISELRTRPEPFDDWMRAPNIAGDPSTYELENEAIARDGRLDASLYERTPWDDRTLLDVGCGTGFWLPRYAQRAARVVGVEPDPQLVALAQDRVAGRNDRRIEVLPGSAEHLPLGDDSIDIAHARFAYFFGAGADAGLDEVARVLRPGGVLLVVDNSWRGGEFAELLRASDMGNAAFDPDETDRWWAERGAIRHEVAGAWAATSPAELERILRIEFPAEVVDGFVSRRPPSAELDYRFAVFEWRP